MGALDLCSETKRIKTGEFPFLHFLPGGQDDLTLADGSCTQYPDSGLRFYYCVTYMVVEQDDLM